MSDDLINGRELLKSLQVDLCDGIACKECSMSTEEGGCRVEEWIDKFPSADRPQGEWIDDGFAHRCSICGKQGVGIEYYNYCPSCGARMKGADDE